eukprot:361335-Chlamydomonas_euryale.AAC.10
MVPFQCNITPECAPRCARPPVGVAADRRARRRTPDDESLTTRARRRALKPSARPEEVWHGVGVRLAWCPWPGAPGLVPLAWCPWPGALAPVAPRVGCGPPDPTTTPMYNNPGPGHRHHCRAERRDARAPTHGRHKKGALLSPCDIQGRIHNLDPVGTPVASFIAACATWGIDSDVRRVGVMRRCHTAVPLLTAWPPGTLASTRFVSRRAGSRGSHKTKPLNCSVDVVPYMDICTDAPAPASPMHRHLRFCRRSCNT